VEGGPNDLFALARQVVNADVPRPRLYQCCGTADGLYDNNRQAKAYFQSLGLSLTYEEGPGEHEWGYWDRQVQRVLAWLPLENHLRQG
jgi:S-formylglutathione hydrolase FrmB